MPRAIRSSSEIVLSGLSESFDSLITIRINVIQVSNDIRMMAGGGVNRISRRIICKCASFALKAYDTVGIISLTIQSNDLSGCSLEPLVKSFGCTFRVIVSASNLVVLAHESFARRDSTRIPILESKLSILLDCSTHPMVWVFCSHHSK